MTDLHTSAPDRAAVPTVHVVDEVANVVPLPAPPLLYSACCHSDATVRAGRDTEHRHIPPMFVQRARDFGPAPDGGRSRDRQHEFPTFLAAPARRTGSESDV